MTFTADLGMPSRSGKRTPRAKRSASARPHERTGLAQPIPQANTFDRARGLEASFAQAGKRLAATADLALARRFSASLRDLWAAEADRPTVARCDAHAEWRARCHTPHLTAVKYRISSTASLTSAPRTISYRWER